MRQTSGRRESVQLTAGNAFFVVGIWARISRKDSPAKLSKQLVYGGKKVSKKLKNKKPASPR